MGGGRVHGGAAIWTERILNLADIPVFERNIPHFSLPRFLRYPEVHWCRSQAGAQDQTDHTAGTTARTCERRGLRRQASEVGQGRGRLEQLVDAPKRVKRWWRMDGSGNCNLILRYGNKAIAPTADKGALAVGDKGKLGHCAGSGNCGGQERRAGRGYRDGQGRRTRRQAQGSLDVIRSPRH